METIQYKKRLLENSLRHHLRRGKSVLLLGPRQTGKTTLLNQISSDLTLSFLSPSLRQRYEKDPGQLIGEIKDLAHKKGRKTLVILDEIQKVPEIMDIVQELIDRKITQFILTGSSARKLKKNPSANLLPGRVVSMRLDPFVHEEIPEVPLKDLLLYGSLPVIIQEEDPANRETDLRSYVETYLEEEVRSEALVRNVGSFSRFLELAALESGKIVSFRAIAQDIGVSHLTISSYFEILEDCLIAERIDPITKSKTRKRLIKSSRYLTFDLGVRRLCAGEGKELIPERWGDIFEQFVGLELVHHARLSQKHSKIFFWKDAEGPEVDWVLEQEQKYIPVEVKWTESPNLRDVRHVATFLEEYKEAKKGYLVCRCPHPMQLTPKITALPWNEIDKVMDE